MTSSIAEILKFGRVTWGSNKLSLPEIIVCLGVVYGDICRQARSSAIDEKELKKEMGNIVTSTLRWIDDLGYDVQECIYLSMTCQEEFAKKEKR